MTSAAVRHSFLERVVGIAMLNRATIDEVKADPAALRQAAVVVIAVPLIYRLNPFSRIEERSISFGADTYHYGGTLTWTLGLGLVSVALALIGWVISALAFRFVSVRLLESPSVETSWVELARPLGFTNAVYLLSLVSGIPGVELPLSIAMPIWTMAMEVVILSQSFQFSKRRAFAAVIITWAVATMVLLVPVCVYLSQVERTIVRIIPITPPAG